MAQLSPVFGIVATDLNLDGVTDLFLAGNFFGLKPQSGRFDASYGTTLLGDARHRFNYINQTVSGLFVKGEARDVKMIKSPNGKGLIAVAINNDKICLFKRNSR
jgi:hypothetical protein